MRRIWALLVALLAISEVAQAQSPPPPPAAVARQQHPSSAAAVACPCPWRSRPWAFDAVLGIATPWGLAGLSAEYAPIEHLSLAAGVGTNLFGWQLASMARARFTPEKQSSFYAGAGYSQGRHVQAEATRDGVFSVLTGPLTAMGHDTKRGHDWRTARWVNVELGIERRESRGLDVRGFVGSAFLLNPSAGVPRPPDNSQSELLPVRGFMLYAGTALGFSP